MKGADNNMRFTEPFESILKVLAICVLVDKRERDRELIEFCHCAELHNQHLHPDKIVCPSSIRKWFDHHKTELTLRLKRDDSERYMTEQLASIRDRGLQRQVLTSMFNIAVSDYELHDEECAYIKLALNVWDSALPDPTEVEIYA